MAERCSAQGHSYKNSYKKIKWLIKQNIDIQYCGPIFLTRSFEQKCESWLVGMGRSWWFPWKFPNLQKLVKHFYADLFLRPKVKRHLSFSQKQQSLCVKILLHDFDVVHSKTIENQKWMFYECSECFECLTMFANVLECSRINQNVILLSLVLAGTTVNHFLFCSLVLSVVVPVSVFAALPLHVNLYCLNFVSFSLF